jgi:hypothetical protein
MFIKHNSSNSVIKRKHIAPNFLILDIITAILLWFIRVYLRKLICDRIHNQLNQINTRNKEQSIATDLARRAPASEELGCKMEKTEGGLVGVQDKGGHRTASHRRKERGRRGVGRFSSGHRLRAGVLSARRLSGVQSGWYWTMGVEGAHWTLDVNCRRRLRAGVVGARRLSGVHSGWHWTPGVEGGHWTPSIKGSTGLPAQWRW